MCRALRLPPQRGVSSIGARAPRRRAALGVGAEPGAVDVIDLRTLARVASVDVGQQAGGIDFWKNEAPSSR